MTHANANVVIDRIISSGLQFVVVDTVTYNALSDVFETADEQFNLERRDHVYMTESNGALQINGCVVACSSELTSESHVEYHVAEIVAHFITHTVSHVVICTLNETRVEYHVISGVHDMRLVQTELTETEIIRYLAHCANRWK